MLFFLSIIKNNHKIKEKSYALHTACRACRCCRLPRLLPCRFAYGRPRHRFFRVFRRTAKSPSRRKPFDRKPFPLRKPPVFLRRGTEPPLHTAGALPRTGRGFAALATRLGGNFTPPMGRHAAVFLPRYPHHRRRLAAGALPAAPPGTHCLAAARQMVQLYGAPSAHCHRGAGRGGSLAPDLRTGGRAVFLSRGTAHQRQYSASAGRTQPNWMHGSPPTPKVILRALPPNRKPIRTADTTLYFCPALRERRTEP